MPFIDLIENRQRAAALFSSQCHERLYQSAVLDHGQGQLWLDDLVQPKTAVVKNGITILAGQPESLPDTFWKHSPSLFLMPDNERWHQWRARYLPQAIEVTRYRMNPSSLNQDHLSELANTLPRDAVIEPLASDDLLQLTHQWALPIIENYHSINHFLATGFGFVLRVDGQIQSVIYTGTVADREIEIEVETAHSARSKGLATGLSAYMLSYCLERGIVPHWATVNPVSVRLAERLGYVLQQEYTVYCLSGSYTAN